MGRRVLVVTTVEHAEDELRAELGDDVDELKVVVPVVRQSVLDWLANDERARRAAEEAAGRTADALAGDTVEAVAGEADPALAVQDALATFDADEIVVVTHPDDEATWLEERADVEDGAFLGVPVRRLTISER
jgi:hypothetical protein